MEKGWNAKGLLKPLWTRVGGRDRLAELTGIRGQTLSAYNSGKRPLGHVNAQRIADVLGVSLLELGAPAEALEPRDGLAEELLRRVETVERNQLEGGKNVGQALEALSRAVAQQTEAAVRWSGDLREIVGEQGTRLTALERHVSELRRQPSAPGRER